jgi:hypothetical protein
MRIKQSFRSERLYVSYRVFDFGIDRRLVRRQPGCRQQQRDQLSSSSTPNLQASIRQPFASSAEPLRPSETIYHRFSLSGNS